MLICRVFVHFPKRKIHARHLSLLLLWCAVTPIEKETHYEARALLFPGCVHVSTPREHEKKGQVIFDGGASFPLDQKLSVSCYNGSVYEKTLATVTGLGRASLPGSSLLVASRWWIVLRDWSAGRFTLLHGSWESRERKVLFFIEFKLSGSRNMYKRMWGWVSYQDHCGGIGRVVNEQSLLALSSTSWLDESPVD